MGSNSGKSAIVHKQEAPDLRGNARVDFNKKDFDALVYNKAYDVYIDKAFECPCRNVKDHQALSSCKNCGGSGWVYINRTESRAVLQSMNYETQYKEWSQEMRGTSKITFLKKDHLQYMDRVTVRNATMTSHQVCNIKTISGAERARVIYPIVEIEDVFLFQGTDSKLIRLEQDTDYTFDDNWITVTRDLTGLQYPTLTIRYRHNPQYLVLELSRGIMTSREKVKGRDKNNEMPLLAVGRLCHYVIDEENYDNTLLHDNSYEKPCK